MVRYVVGHGTLRGAPAINHQTLKAKGFTDASLESLEKAFGTAFDIRFVFNKYTLGEGFCREALGFTDQELNEPTLDMLSSLGFSKPYYEAANTSACGAMPLEGAPFLKDEHLPVFDCA